MKAGRAVEAQRGRLGLTQKEMGVDETTYRDFVNGRSWPQARSRARIEAALRWPVGEIARLAASATAAETDGDDPDMTALMRSDLPEDVKIRIIGRLIAAEIVGGHADNNGEKRASQGG